MPSLSKHLLIFIILLVGISSCHEEQTTLFTRISKNESGIDFNNELNEDNPELSIINYPYFYNGGGVAVGDINNDGRPDIAFTANTTDNGLFLNLGDFKFENISEKSGIAKKKGWSTGITMADINLDGWLDIYICRSALEKVEDRRNLLFINNHDLTFTESASKYGLDDPGYSTQASFFDYDKDGDLDMFLINQSDPKYAKGYLDYVQTRNQKGDASLGNKLYRNDGGHFSNVTSGSGITSTVFSFSLGVSTTDIDLDGWPDIYIANDFEERDYLYINRHDGTFTDSLTQKMDHNSMFSMGVDIADYNNDQLPDVVVLDMLPEGNEAMKMHLGGDNYTQNNYLFKNGMFFQYMKNTLQKNNGDGTFSEIGQLAGISNTDWSWSPLFADFDNDGRKDLFITNGYKHDNTNMEFMVYAMDQSQHIQDGGKAPSPQDYISHMPGISLPNYVFQNQGGDHFENKIKAWGFDENTFSHGAAYADLDNDGDLDVITNNTNDLAGVYRNNSEKQLKNNFIKFKLEGDSLNRSGIGAKVYAYAGNETYYLEQSPVRGYQSTVSTELIIGLGTQNSLDSVRIVWPDLRVQVMNGLKANITTTLRIADAQEVKPIQEIHHPLLMEVAAPDFMHVENDVNDFARQFLLPHFLSQSGPCLSKGDVNGDGREDIFVGGAKGQAGGIFIQEAIGAFRRLTEPALDLDAASEDVGSAFFDADGDKDLDLYVVSGGYDLEENSPLLQDRLYLNDGKGNLSNATSNLPQNLTNKKCVRPVDFDNDGDLDLFVGGQVIPGRYPLYSLSKIYFNNGKGNFAEIKPASASLGIINDAQWVDLNKDGKKDLIVAGEWMELRAYLTQAPLFVEVTKQWFPYANDGWWSCLEASDMDGDGDMDLVAGNYGLNSQLKADEQHPLQLYALDIDVNGSIDPIITRYIGGQSFPLVSRDDMINQVPVLKKKFPDYPSYAKAGIKEILSEEQLKTVPVLKAGRMGSCYFENTGKMFVRKELPIEAQFSAINAASVADINHDGHLDFVLAGNSVHNRIYLGRDDANHGVVLLGDGKGNFKYMPQYESGLDVRGEVRSMVIVGNKLMFGVNNGRMRCYNAN